METPYSSFWWVRSKRDREVTIAKQKGDDWFLFGGHDGRWGKSELLEDYELLGAVAKFDAQMA